MKVEDFYENWDLGNIPKYAKLLMNFEEKLIFDIISNLDEFDKIKNKKDALILDCGCGFGSFYNLTKDLNTIYLDISLNLLKKFNIKTNKICGDILNLPFKDNSFDLILCINVLEHVDYKKALSKIRRVLKKEGTCIVVVVNKNSIINEELFTDWKIYHQPLGIEDFEGIEGLYIAYWKTFYFVHPIFKILPTKVLGRFLKFFEKVDNKLANTKMFKNKGQFLICVLKVR
jgi:ubiquinone/menaquinone biosynthesis C-methylase UbiE